MAFDYPEIPVKPKLFKYRLDTFERTSKYELSTIELNQEHQILVDYNMGIRVDLVDKEVYQVNPNLQKTFLSNSGKDEELTAKQIEDLRNSLLNERDKFILSDKDSVPTFDTTEKEIE